MQTDFKIIWKNNSSINPFNYPILTDIDTDSEDEIILQPRKQNFFFKNSIQKDESIKMDQMKKIKEEELENQKGFLKNMFGQQSTGVCSNPLLKSYQFEEDTVDQNNNDLNKRKIWEIEAQIARDIFSLGIFLI